MKLQLNRIWGFSGQEIDRFTVYVGEAKDEGILHHIVLIPLARDCLIVSFCSSFVY